MKSSHRSVVFVVVLLAGMHAQSAVAATAIPTHTKPGDHALVDEWVTAKLPQLVERYEHLHANPELSLQETETAALVALALEAAGYQVTRGVGGTGVVGVLENGKGPVVLIRGDMDALPVTEATGLRYASQARTLGPEGVEVGVMHACGHDIHTTALVGAAEFLASAQSAWRGTVVILAQPAEELGQGAKNMIADGLFKRFPVPDYFLALHVDGTLPAGRIGFIPGWAAANVDSVDIEVHGRGGHGARPNRAIDPIVASAHMVTAFQTIVSRRVDPVTPAVITVGSIHGGSKHNVIPDNVHLQLTVRSYSDEIRNQLLTSIRQVANDTCTLFQCPTPPSITIKDEYTPAMYNDPDLVAAAVTVFQGFLPPDDVIQMPAAMGGEDFGRYSRNQGTPGFLFRLGSVDAAKWEASLSPNGPPLPSLHSSRYAPDPAPTLETGIGAMSRLALALLARP